MTVWRGLIVALALTGLAGAAAAQRLRYHQATPEQKQAIAAELAGFSSPTLERFSSEEEFRRYLGAVLAAERARYGWWAASGHIQFAQAAQPADVQSDALEPICPEADPLCDADTDSERITVTGARTPPPSNPSITNNQMRGVEEGDIVKQIGRFLLVLQDGRVFVIDTRGTGGRRLLLADRVDVYRDPEEDMWYDEMLVFGDRVLVTGYSYDHDATKLSVFRLGESGRLSREGVFYVSSNDYYSSSNYATRLIGDNLVIYTPFEASLMARADFKWPVVRRWTAGEPGDAALRGGRPLFDAAEIYRPVRAADNPTVHSVSVCPLGPVDSGRDLQCRTTAFVADNGAQWYLTDTDAFLWTTSRDDPSSDSQACDHSGAEMGHLPALLYRVPVGGGAPNLVGARGLPPDQFSLHSSGGRFRALLKERAVSCDDEEVLEASLAFLDFPLSGFGDTVRDLPEDRYTPLPGVKSLYIANRFTDRYLVYGSLGRYHRGLAEHAMPPAYVVPVDRPGDARPLGIRHTVIRAEQAGSDIVLTGYRDRTGLVVSLVDLDGAPRIASSVRLDRRFESEGRSHAFNSLIEPGGGGVMGLPTIDDETLSSREPWRSVPSDLSYLTVDLRGRLRHVGELEHRFDYDDDDAIPGYECQVSCVDWYGNSRPIFTDGRIFALSGTELIEGRFSGGDIVEVQRLNIALAWAGAGSLASE